MSPLAITRTYHVSFAYDDAAHKPDLQITPIVCGLGASFIPGVEALTVLFITAPAAVSNAFSKIFGTVSNVVNSGTAAITGVPATTK